MTSIPTTTRPISLPDAHYGVDAERSMTADLPARLQAIRAELEAANGAAE